MSRRCAGGRGASAPRRSACLAVSKAAVDANPNNTSVVRHDAAQTKYMIMTW